MLCTQLSGSFSNDLSADLSTSRQSECFTVKEEQNRPISKHRLFYDPENEKNLFSTHAAEVLQFKMLHL